MMCLDPVTGSGFEHYRGNFPEKIIIAPSYSIVPFFSRMFSVLFDIIKAFREQAPIQKGFLLHHFDGIFIVKIQESVHAQFNQLVRL
jgi:hypothetical protein